MDAVSLGQAVENLPRALQWFLADRWYLSAADSEVVLCRRSFPSLAAVIWISLVSSSCEPKVICSSRPFRIHLLPGTDVVVTIGSSMKALMGGCWTPGEGSSALNLSRLNNLHLGHLAGHDQLRCCSPGVDPQAEAVVIVQYEVSELAWDVVPVQSHLDQLV